jgi:hypothetical protein
MNPISTTAAALSLALSISLLAGCKKGHDDGPYAVPAPRSSGGALPSSATTRVVVAELTADPSLDAQAIRDAFRDAETGLLGCLDAKGGSGTVALMFAVEHDGAVSDVREGASTYKGEPARRCIAHAVDEMHLPPIAGSRADASVVLQIRPISRAE